MITHNMKDAIAHGNRRVMMYEGDIIYDVAGEEKKKLHVSDLLEKFEQASGGSFANDRMILSWLFLNPKVLPLCFVKNTGFLTKSMRK